MKLSHIVFAIGLICTFLLFAPVASLIYIYLPSQQEKAIQDQSKLVENYIASAVIPLLLTDDILSINEVLLLCKQTQTNLEFLYLLDKDYKPIASTFPEGVPEDLISENKKFENKSHKIHLNHSPYLVFNKSLRKGELGFLCYGISLKQIYSDTRKNLTFVIILLSLVLMITIAGSFIVGNVIGRPLDQLARYTQKVPYHSEKFPTLLGFYSSETKMLFESFSKMLDRIIKADSEKEEFHKKMASSEKLAAVGTLASGVAHEINNPLNGIEACINRMIKVKDKPEKIVEYGESIKQSLKHMKNVVHQLLDFSKPYKYIFEPLQVTEVVDSVLKLLEFQLAKNKIILNVNYENPLPLIQGDKQHLRQILLNLILNSIDAMPKGGKLSIKIHLIHSQIHIFISDTGTGIPLEIRDKIFEPFFTTKDQGKGTGLGLSVSYRIALEHQGTLKVNGQKGNGTEFVLQIPVHFNMKGSHENSVIG